MIAFGLLALEITFGLVAINLAALLIALMVLSPHARGARR